MKSLEVKLPDEMAAELEALVRRGWFQSEDEVVRAALIDFLRHHRLDLLEKYQRDDIAWAVQQKGVTE